MNSCGPLRSRRRLAVAVASVTFLACVGTACSSDSVETSTGACDSPGVRSDQVSLGLVFPDTGPLAATLAPVRSGVEARVQEANAAGGVHGRKIVYEWRNDAASPDTNNHAVHELVESEHVFGLVEATVAATGSAAYLNELGVPVTGFAAEKVWTQYRNMFTHFYLATDAPSVDTFGTYVRAQGGHRAAVIKPDVASSGVDINATVTTSLVAAGIEVIPTPYTFNPDTSDFTRLGQQIRDSGADVVVGSMPAENYAKVLDGLRAAGADVKVALSASGYDQSLLASTGHSLAGLSIYLTYLPFEADTPAHRRYLTAMARYAPELTPPTQEWALSAYIATDMFLHGLELAGTCPTRAGFVAALSASTDFDAGGLLPGAINMREQFGQPNHCYAFARVNQSGTGYEVVSNNNTPGAPNPYVWCGSSLAR